MSTDFGRRIVRPLGTALATLALTACASVAVNHVALPPPTPPQFVEQDAEQGASPALLVRDVSLPAYLEGDRIVLESDGDAFQLARKAAWSERLSDGVKRTLRDALAQRVGAGRVRALGDDRPTEAELNVDFVALDPAHDRLHLDAVWVMTCRETGGGLLGRTWLEVPIGSRTPKGIAAATSAALSQLADDLAPLLRCEAPADRMLAGTGRRVPWHVVS